MPTITAGFALRLPAFIFSSKPHLCIQWSSSLRLSRKPDGFEVPVFIPWKDKIAYKFIVDGRWMTNDAEPTEVDHGFVNNVYTAPSKPASKEPPAPPSYHSETEVEPEPEPERVEKGPDHANKSVANGSALDERHETPAPMAEPTPENERPSSFVEEVKAVAAPAVEAVQGAVAQVVPGPQEVEKASDEVRSNPDRLF
jgi:hypothetical protein